MSNTPTPIRLTPEQREMWKAMSRWCTYSSLERTYRICALRKRQNERAADNRDCTIKDCPILKEGGIE